MPAPMIPRSARSSSTARTISWLVCSSISTLISGCSVRNLDNRFGGYSLIALVLANNRILPRIPVRNRCKSSRRLAVSLRMARARSRNASPAGVNTTPRLFRSSKGVRSDSSSALMRALAAPSAIGRLSAARVRFPQAATETNRRRSTRSKRIDNVYRCFLKLESYSVFAFRERCLAK